MLMRDARPAPRPLAAGRHPSEAAAPEPAPRAATPAQDAGADPTIALWFREHVERVWRVVARLGVPAHGVEDIVQETFIAASRRRADIGAGQEKSFLLSTAVRLCANYRRKAYVRHEVHGEGGFEGDASPLPDAEQLLIAKRSRELLDRLLAELPEAQRTVFVLYELEGSSVPEIAALLEQPLGTVSARVWRARARFSQLAANLQSLETHSEGA